MTKKKHICDVAIVGGGMAGLTTAIGLAMSGMTVTVVDRADADITTDPGFDGRACALSYSTCQLFEALDIWPHMEVYAQPILEVRVTDGPSLLHTHLDHRDLGEGPLGHMLENRHTRIALYKRLAEVSGVTLIAPDKVGTIERNKREVTLTTAGGHIITAPLLLGIDGRDSQVREWAKIKYTKWGYSQDGIVCAIEHELSHGGVAHERFLPSGPFAILPLTGNRSSIVWTEKEHLTKTIMALPDRSFEAEVARRVGGFLGDVKVVGGRWAFPLTLQFAETFIQDRIALVGDAAHGMHPIAGQGLNLALRGVAALLEVLSDAFRAGQDLGSATTLRQYEQWRTIDTATLLSVTDVLNRLFSNNILPVRAVRDLGLAAVNEMPVVKNFLMSHARGTVGDLPKLLRGERL
jgi:2-octaprenyl-6-methoxyphenol hydroxylase